MLHISPRLYLCIALTAALPACSSEKSGASESQTDTGGAPAHGDCDQLLLCIAATAPDMAAQLEMTYGPDGTCWSSSAEVEQGCLTACEASLKSQAVVHTDEPACGGTGSGTTSNDTTTTNDTTGPAEPTSGPTSEPQTSEPTTSEPEPSGTGEFTTREFTTEPDPSDSRGDDTAGNFGNCGWDEGNGWYGCTGVPGLSDPAGIDPIACPADVQEGAQCDEQGGPVTGVGCCTPGGENFYCARGTITVEGCG